MKTPASNMAILMVGLFLFSPEIQARSTGVGLGFAGGVVYAGGDLDSAAREKIGGGWGFFVDIPLVDYFHLSPSTTIYKIDSGNGSLPATDVDLNFKFIVPISNLKLGFGLLGGVTVAEQTYQGHWGLLGYTSYRLVSNLELFGMGSYKHVSRKGKNLNDIHFQGGIMIRL